MATLFAPTDEAFQAVGADTLDSLLADPAALAQILKYHVIVGEHRPSPWLAPLLLTRCHANPAHLPSSRAVPCRKNDPS